MYALNGSKGARLRFQRSASVTLVSMKAEYYLRNVDTNWVKLSIEFSSRPANPGEIFDEETTITGLFFVVVEVCA